jgi:probable F420-dependent oxidoreductase
MRHPGVLARDLATLDLLSDGRLEVGIGAGWHRDEHRQLGVPFPEAGERVSRLAESVTILRSLLSGGALTFAGDHYTVEGLTNYPRLPGAGPPIMIGGGGRRILQIAARLADIVGLNTRLSNGRTARGATVMRSATAAATATKLAWVREAAGSRFEQLEISTRIYRGRIGVEPRHAAQQLSAEVGMPASDVLESPHLIVGSVDKIATDLQRWRETLGISYVVVTDDLMRPLAPVVARLGGT